MAKSIESLVEKEIQKGSTPLKLDSVMVPAEGNTIWNTKCGETRITWASHFLYKLCRKGGQSLYERKNNRTL